MTHRDITREILASRDAELLEELDLMDDDDIPTNDSGNTPFAAIADVYLSRRRVLAGLAGTAAVGALASPGISRVTPAKNVSGLSSWARNFR